MSQSLPYTNLEPFVLTTKEAIWFYSTRCLVVTLSIVGVACTFSDRYTLFAGLFAWGCPLIANVIWQLRIATQFPPISTSTQPLSNSPWLVVPLFCLPIVDHIAYAFKRHFKKQSDDKAQSPLFRSESTSTMRPAGKFQKLVGNLQNHLVVALITTGCQIYSIVAYMS